MYYLLAQICLLGRDFDVEGWMDILVLVVLAAVYVLGAIIKAAAKGKKAEEQAKEEQALKPGGKPSKGGRGLLEQFIMEVKQAAEEAKTGTKKRPPLQKVPTRTAQAQTALQKYTAKAKQEVPVQPKVAPVKPKISQPIRQVQAGYEKLGEIDKGIQALPEITTTKVVGLPDKKKVTPAELIESMYLSEVLADYEDPDELKRAILHYEILGRPIALRDPSANIIGL